MDPDFPDFFEPFADFFAIPILLQTLAHWGLHTLYANGLVMSTAKWTILRATTVGTHFSCGILLRAAKSTISVTSK
jgi:hypothetical protein